MQIRITELLFRNLQDAAARAHIGVRRIDGFAHHFTKLPGHGHATGAWHLERFNQHQLAAIRRPGESRHHTDFGLLLRFFGSKLRNTEQLFCPLRRDRPGLHLAFGFPARALAKNRRHVSLEVAQTRLATVARRHELQRLIGEDGIFLGQPMLRTQLRNQVAPRDLHFLFRCVAGDANHFQTIAQRRGNVVQIVRGADEEH